MKRALLKLSETRKLLSGGRAKARPEGREASIPNAKERSNSESTAPQKRADGVRARTSIEEYDPGNGERVAIFSRNGEYWQVGYQGYTSSIGHRRGLELISFLLQHPGQECLAMELTHEGEARRRAYGPEDRRVGDDTGAPVLDAEAKRSYRERLREIRDEVENLREANDVERASKLEEEQDFLTRELARALGLFGRDRKFGSEAERARKRVSIAITRAIRLLSLHDEHLGRYLERSIRTGNLCCYIPDPGNPVKWSL
jgi:hypothetical protein